MKRRTFPLFPTESVGRADKRLDGETVAVTGGGQGIGRAIALYFAGAGYSVSIADRDEADGLECVNKLHELGAKAFFQKIDCRNPKKWSQASACVTHGFDALGLDLIVGVIAPGNQGSKRVLEKLGMKLTRRLDFYGTGLLYFSLSRDQYAAGS